MKKKLRASILVVNDSSDTLKILQSYLEPKGFKILIAQGPFEAIRILDSQSVTMLILDKKILGLTGINLIKYTREKHKDIEIIVSIDSEVLQNEPSQIKEESEIYLKKPFTPRSVFQVVRCASERQMMRKTMKAQLHKLHSAPFGIIGNSKPVQRILDAIEKTASTSATVIISGESGTGKELVARAIHYCSPRAAAPFVPVNCGSIPENLLESELFGHVKGAFTGAFETRPGFFQTADVGTIFLDEISETSLAMQVKLLRVLQEKEIFMVGSRRSQKVDVRILASTNKDLIKLVNNGLFRADLYYRLNVINIHLPPLREREDDAILLIQYFAAKFAKAANKPIPQFTPAALDILKKYKWPGNVRELENVIHRLVIMNDEPIIDVPVLHSLMGSTILGEKYVHRSLAAVESDYIKKVLISVNNNKTQAAKILGIDRKTLREKLKKL